MNELITLPESSSGRYVRVTIDSESNWAFIPNPLPPKLNFDMELIGALSNADRALGELSGLGRNLPNPQIFVQPFMRREAVLSSKIEGTETELDELYAYEIGGPQVSLFSETGASKSDTVEVANYVKAMEYGLNRTEDLPISLRLIRELHRLLLTGVRGVRKSPGQFRRSQNWIGRASCKISEANYVPPPTKEMHHCLHQFEKYIHSDSVYPQLIRLSNIHYQFEAIHPFNDGNGRIGRLLISLLLVDWDMIPSPLLYLSAFFEKNRQEYYNHLLNVSSQGAWREWIIFFLKGVHEQSLDVVQRIKKLQDLQEKWHRQLDERGVSHIVHRLVDYLFESPILTVREAEEILEVSYNAAWRSIALLVEEGIVKKYGYRKALFLPLDIYRIILET